MVIHSSSLLFIPANSEIPDFDKVTAKVPPRYLRRVDRFALISLWGAIDCVSRHEITADSPLMLVSDSGGRSSMKSLKECVINENHLPAPYTFINTLTNSASFLIAKALSLVSENLALCAGSGSFPATINLLTKSSILCNNKMVLLGFVEEGIEGGEGLTRYDRSAWFLLSSPDSTSYKQLSSAPELPSNLSGMFSEQLPPEILHAANYASNHAKIIV
jgi:hypothetical protein